MARINEAHERLKNHYGLNGNNSVADNNTQNTSSVIKCEDCAGNGRFWIIPESYQIIKYVNFFTGKMKFREGKFFIKFPWKTHIEILDRRPQIINPCVNKFKTLDGDTVSADFSLEYRIIEKENYIMNGLNFNEKIIERVKSIMQQYFRTHVAEYIATTPISIRKIDEEECKKIERDFGIIIIDFHKTKLDLENYDKEKNKRQQQLMQIDTKKATLEGEMNIQDMKRELALFANQTENMILKEKINNVSECIDKYPPEQQSSLLKSILEITEIAKNSANINYFSGAGIDGILNSLNNNGRKK